MSAGRCHQGTQANVALTRAKGDLLGVARAATHPGARGERAQRLIPDLKAVVQKQRTNYAEHVAHCDQCTAVDMAVSS